MALARAYEFGVRAAPLRSTDLRPRVCGVLEATLVDKASVWRAVQGMWRLREDNMEELARMAAEKARLEDEARAFAV